MKDLQTAPVDLFFYWINERHRIYLKRTAGHPKPWTDDRILRDYKFTNAFRQLDRGTVWLTNFLKAHEGAPLEEVAFNICWYRMFNWTGTGDLLGWQTSWDVKAVEDKLDWALNAEGKQVFTGAHIVWSEPGLSKIEAIVDYCDKLFDLRGVVVAIARKTRSLESVFNVLTEVRGVGGFMAYEMVSDMRWTPLLDDATDILTWANPGPGAIRGLRRLDLPWKPRAKAIESMRHLLYLSTDVAGPLEAHVPALEMREIEHSLCEFDKYCRVKFGEGEPRSKYPGGA